MVGFIREIYFGNKIMNHVDHRKSISIGTFQYFKKECIDRNISLYISEPGLTSWDLISLKLMFPAYVRYIREIKLMKNFMAKKIEELKNDPSSPVCRVIAGLLVSFIISSYPIFVFLIYMWENGFYSYDVIGEGFSLSIFFYANLILIVVVSLFMFGSLTTTMLSWRNLPSNSGKRKIAIIEAFLSNLPFVIINLIVFFGCLYLMYSTDEKGFYLFIILVSFVVVSLITSLAVGTAGFYFKVVVIVTGLMYSLPLLNPEKASILLADGLRFFGAGNQNVQLISTNTQSPFEVEGELVFLSPEYVYLKGEGEGSLMVVPRHDFLNIIYEKISNQ